MVPGVPQLLRLLRAPFRGSGGSISILGILYWKIQCSNFLQYKVPHLGSIRGGVLFSLFARFFACGVLRRILHRKFEKFHSWTKPSPRYEPAIMHRTKTGILRKIREIEAVSMGVGTLRGYNLYQPPGCNPQTRNHKQASIWKSRLTLMAHGSMHGSVRVLNLDSTAVYTRVAWTFLQLYTRVVCTHTQCSMARTKFSVCVHLRSTRVLYHFNEFNSATLLLYIYRQVLHFCTIIVCRTYH